MLVRQRPESIDSIQSEITRWERLGVAVLPGPRGKKGPRQAGWPTIPHQECWRLSRAAAALGPTNLIVRTGLTADGTRRLGAIDLDGKCPCGHDREDHDAAGCGHEPDLDGVACDCSKYRGVAPEIALARLLAILPAAVGVTRTARGFHIIFWVECPVPDGVLAEYSADLFGGLNPHALQAPWSLHPSGITYEWLQEPGEDLPLVDLEALGLVPFVPKAHRHDRRTAVTTGAPAPADPALRAMFADLMAEVGLHEGGGARRDRRGEFFRCPWHSDGEPSLHVLWDAAVCWCLGCQQGGGLRALRELVPSGANGSPRKFPNDESLIPSGDRVTYGGGDDLVQRIAGLVDQLPMGTFNVEGRHLRECRQYVLTYDCGAGHSFAPRDERGDPTPLSCDASAAICPKCSTPRFLVDARAADGGLPERVHCFRLIARTPGLELFDTGLNRRLTARLKDYRQRHALTAGDAARSLHLEPSGSAFRGHFILAVPVDISTLVTSDGAFDVNDLGECSLTEWHSLQVQEHLAALRLLETPQQLEAFYRCSHGQQRFRHFGAWYGTRVDQDTGELLSAKSAGGAGGSRQRVVERITCPLHPDAQVWRSPAPAPRSSLVRGEGGVLLPTARGPAAGPTTGSAAW